MVHSLKEVVADGQYPIDFSFRYFQALPINVALPAGFVPLSVVVRVQSGNKAVERDFPWPERLVSATARRFSASGQGTQPGGGQ